MGEDVAKADRLIEEKVASSRVPVGFSSSAWYYVKQRNGARALVPIEGSTSAGEGLETIGLRYARSRIGVA